MAWDGGRLPKNAISGSSQTSIMAIRPWLFGAIRPVA